MNNILDLGSISSISEHFLSLTGSSITMTTQFPQVMTRLHLLAQEKVFQFFFFWVLFLCIKILLSAGNPA